MKTLSAKISLAGERIETYSVVEPKKPNAPLRIRLNEAYDAKLVDTKRGYKIYSRTLLGQHHDWVIESPLGMTYHDVDRVNLIKGLHKKSATNHAKYQERLIGTNADHLDSAKRGLGNSALILGSISNRHTPRSRYTRVKQNAQKAVPYLRELKILADAVGYNAPEL